MIVKLHDLLRLDNKSQKYYCHPSILSNGDNCLFTINKGKHS